MRSGVILFAILVQTWCFAGSILADEPVGAMPERVSVEVQPLGGNIKRVISAFQVLGSPLQQSLVSSLSELIEAGDADGLQRKLDAEVLLVATVNPEERVKVRRGPARATLQQFGFTPVLVKILNGSTATKRLRIISPQGGAVYSGVAKLSMQRQQSLELIENENLNREKGRFLAVEMFEQPPLSDRMSGLEVEYVIALILSTEAGRREATIGFDLGQGEQDLGFRGEVPVLFTVRPAVPVRLSIKDEDGRPTTASLIIRDSQGRIYPPQAKRLAPDFFFQPQVYRADGESLLLPPGEFRIQSGRGPEYWTREQTFSVAEEGTSLHDSKEKPAAHQTIEIRLERWVNPQSFGFFREIITSTPQGAHTTLPQRKECFRKTCSAK